MRTDLGTLLDAAEDMLNFGEHEGPCAPYDPYDSTPNAACRLHIENTLRRQANLIIAINLFRPCIPH